MKVTSVSFRLGSLATALFIFGFSASAIAESPNPQAPTLDMPAPMGIQRGTSLLLTLTGANLAEPTGLWTSFPAKVVIPPDQANGKDSARLRVRLEVPKDAPLGFHAIRLATRHGLSNLRIFCVDDLPQVLRADNDHSKPSAQRLNYPCVVAGRVDPETADYYRISVKRGQRLSFEILGRRLGSGLDPQITLYDLSGERELRGGHSNDAPGLQTDSRLTYVFKRDGDYLVEIRDTKWAGGPDYWYRLRVGDFPCATSPMPMAARRGSTVTVGFAGPLVKDVPPVTVTVPSDPLTQAVWVTPRGSNGLCGWPVALAVSDFPEALEREPNDVRPNRIAMPGGMSARFEHGNDLDRFVFAAHKGQRYVVEAQSHQWFSPCDVRMTLTDAMGTELGQSNPQLPSPLDQRIDFTAPAEGDYYLSAEHLFGSSGPSECYRLVVTPYQPAFELSLDLDRYDLPSGGVVAVPVTARRRDFTGPIDVAVRGPGFFHGGGFIRAGESSCLLFIGCSADTPIGPHMLAVEGRASVYGRPLTAYATVRTAVSRELASLPYPPPTFFDHFGVAVTDRGPFTLAVAMPQAEAFRGGSIPVTVAAQRAPRFTGEIALRSFGLPTNMALAAGSIAPGKRETTLELRSLVNAPLGRISVSAFGKARLHGRDVTVTAAPGFLDVVPPFELRVQSSSVRIARGGKTSLHVSAVRRGGYRGSIALEVQDLPAHVAAAKTTIAKAMSSAEIELAAAAEAQPGAHARVHIIATATDAERQRDTSGTFEVSVEKSDAPLKKTAHERSKPR
jgi:hypothetical protein